MDFSPSPAGRRPHRRGCATFIADRDRAGRGRQYHRDLAALPRRAAATPWTPLPVIAELQAKARAQGLWNLFLPAEHAGEYAARLRHRRRRGADQRRLRPDRRADRPLARWRRWSSTATPPTPATWRCCCATAPTSSASSGSSRCSTARIRSAFAMTEPDVASSDATNMEATAVVDGDEVVINGRKWWSTGVGHPDCKIFVFMGLTDPDADRHRRHSMVLVPRDTPGVKVERMLTAMGQYDEPLGHGEVSFTDVRVPARNVLLGPGRAFEIAQGRLGPGRVHHCMRLIGLAEMALELAVRARRPPGPRSASRSPTSAATASASPTPGSPSTRPACWCCTPPGSSTPPARGCAVRGQPDQGGGAATWPSRSSTWPSSCTAAAASTRTSRSPPPGSAPGACGWPTVPTRCTAAWSPSSSSAKYADEPTGPGHRGRLRPGRRPRRRASRARGDEVLATDLSGADVALTTRTA